jgi:flavin-dependent dehydrogenase
MSFDVAVVGAGLAGLQCARLLASRGLRVALIDRKRSIGAPVHTTGIFVRKTWEDFPIPHEQLGDGIRDVYLYSPRGRSLHLNADRDEFRVGRMNWIYAYLLEQCSRAGVRWFPSTEWNPRTINAAFVVGADGVRSRVAREFGLDRNTQVLVGLEDIVESRETQPALHCYLDPRLAPGYIAWVVHDRGEAHVGVAGYRSRFEPAAALAEFRRRLGLQSARVLERRGGLIPVNGVLRTIANRNALLVGDAAGAVSPLTAGGLDGSLRLSTHAAAVIAAYLDKRDPAILRAYDGAQFQARFVSRRWMRRAFDVAHNAFVADAAVALLRLPLLRAFASHVFFSRGSFPDPAPLTASGSESAIAAAQ